MNCYNGVIVILTIVILTIVIPIFVIIIDDSLLYVDNNRP